ncbi:Biotin carboxylase [Actinomadura rubteroloni]|uniref:biotin carboxylase n=2 Tax=Actinomadura rubteroloni TaxID=1926885 RepID=A0A2P4UFC7_9ACTN|nr:Biotin carboxylase [Actinomadura rubteroloni]
MTPMRRVLIANRGEIAVRIARACRDAGLVSIAVYAEQDVDALHVRAADEAYALGGRSPAETYLDIAGLLAVAARADADAVHPGYGFLAENADFATAVAAAGLTWIGPPPAAIAALGDKVAARDIARRVNAPLAPGTDGPVADAEEVLEFARRHGLPVALKAAFGGGGRGLRVARTLAEIPAAFEAATREAVAAFGRGECFVERYLENCRHVETQCLADRHGNVMVVSTRDCTLQRRHQKLVEEAPAPFLTDEQTGQLVSASRAVLREAGYVGAGTCEFLLAPDGTIAFLEVNTRLQVEHPVTEEVTGIDLVREMFRIADGGVLEPSDPPVRGHAIEFRLNAEDAGRGFLPAAGTLTRFRPPSGPGVRMDAGYVEGAAVPAEFDSLIGKLIVTGRTRREAIERSRRALAELEVAGIPTVVPFHRALLADEAFTGEPFTVHTRWIETEFSGAVPPHADAPDAPADDAGHRRVTVEVGGRRLEVVLRDALGAALVPAAGRPAPARAARRAGPAGAGGDALVSPMQGTVVKVLVADGAPVAAGDTVLVLEAMKMEQGLTAHRSGTVRDLSAQAGATVAAGAAVCRIVDPPAPEA